MPHADCDERRSPLVLVVDDDADTREIFAMNLRLEGFRAEEDESGATALEMAFTLEPDAILLDQAMPDMDGRETARRLRADSRTRDTPLVMVTGFGEATASGRELRAAADCDAYLTKPCEMDAVVSSLRAALQVRSAP